jgi:predicted nucleotidyltransferase
VAAARSSRAPLVLLPLAFGPATMTGVALLAGYERLLGRLLVELRARYGGRLVAVAVFGSVGRGTPRQDSDVDLLIVARDLPDGRFARLGEFQEVEGRLGDAARLGLDQPPVPIAPVFKTPEELERGSPLFLDMVEDARILHDPAGVLARRLGRLRERLRELGARRVWLGNAWYWDLKPDFKPGDVIEL